jgi:hypothetical protein
MHILYILFISHFPYISSENTLSAYFPCILYCIFPIEVLFLHLFWKYIIRLFPIHIIYFSYKYFPVVTSENTFSTYSLCKLYSLSLIFPTSLLKIRSLHIYHAYYMYTVFPYKYFSVITSKNTFSAYSHAYYILYLSCISSENTFSAYSPCILYISLFQVYSWLEPGPRKYIYLLVVGWPEFLLHW